MQSKEELVQAITEYVKLDNEIRVLQKQVTDRRKRRMIISDQLTKTMRTHEIDCFEVQGGTIAYKQCNTKKPLSQKLLGELLQQFFHDDPPQAESLKTYLLDHRQESKKECLVRKITNPRSDPSQEDAVQTTDDVVVS
jgi:hypothetical protein